MKCPKIVLENVYTTLSVAGAILDLGGLTSHVSLTLTSLASGTEQF